MRSSAAICATIPTLARRRPRDGWRPMRRLVGQAEPVRPGPSASRTSCAGSASATAAAPRDTDGSRPASGGRYAARTTNSGAFADGHSTRSSASSRSPRTASSARSPIRDRYRLSAVRRRRRPTSPRSIARFADAAKKAGDDADAQGGSGVDREQGWTYRAGLQALPAERRRRSPWRWISTATAAARTATALPLHPGRSAAPARPLTGRRVRGRRRLAQNPGRDRAAPTSRSSFADKPGFDDALSPQARASCCASPVTIAGVSDRLELIFNAYEVGPYSCWPVRGRCPYEPAAPLLRADGPTADR